MDLVTWSVQTVQKSNFNSGFGIETARQIFWWKAAEMQADFFFLSCLRAAVIWWCSPQTDCTAHLHALNTLSHFAVQVMCSVAIQHLKASNFRHNCLAKPTLGGSEVFSFLLWGEMWARHEWSTRIRRGHVAVSALCSAHICTVTAHFVFWFDLKS